VNGIGGGGVLRSQQETGARYLRGVAVESQQFILSPVSVGRRPRPRHYRERCKFDFLFSPCSDAATASCREILERVNKRGEQRLRMVQDRAWGRRLASVESSLAPPTN
jgi:hypothetical protein